MGEGRLKIALRGHDCVYDIVGDGPWLTLLHSVGLSTRQGWRSQSEFFSRHFRTLSFDFRGLGESSPGAEPLGQAKAGVLVGSVVAMVLGTALAWLTGRRKVSGS